MDVLTPTHPEDQQTAIYLQIDKLKALSHLMLQMEVAFDAAHSGNRQCMMMVIEDVVVELERLFDGYCGGGMIYRQLSIVS